MPLIETNQKMLFQMLKGQVDLTKMYVFQVQRRA